MAYQQNSQYYGSGQGSGYQRQNGGYQRQGNGYQNRSSQYSQNGNQGTQMQSQMGFNPATIQSTLTKLLEDHKKALPQGFQQERFVFNCITMVQDMTKDSQKLDKLRTIKPDTVASCFLKGAILGLDFFNGECYAIPYKDDMQFQTDYKGEIKVCKRWSKNPIRDIFAKVVREGDEFYEEVDSGNQRIYFRPIPFSNNQIVGAFAVVKFVDGSMLYESMSKEDIEKIRDNFSKAANSPAWTKTPGEMFKKTVLRRLCKFIDLDFDSMDQYKAFEAGGDAEFELPKQTVQPEQNTQTVNVFREPDPVAQIAQAPDQKAYQQVSTAKQEPVPAQTQTPEQTNAGRDDYAAFEQAYQESGSQKVVDEPSDATSSADEYPFK